MNNESFQGVKYEIGNEVGHGGMGAVWQATDRRLNRTVAMKVIRSANVHETDRQRFLREAHVLARLEHPNIVPIHDLAFDANGQPYYTMKLVQGVTLKEVINRLKTGEAEMVAKYPLSQLLTIFQKVCDALAFAHSKGIIHRDLKPENVMLGEYGEVLVLDWGLAKVLEGGGACLSERAEQQEDRHGSPQSSEGGALGEARPTQAGLEAGALTLDGQIMGTPHYMAPEQAEGRVGDLDERTDVFSLGGILYSLLTLRPPTGGTTVKEVLVNIKSGYIAPPVIYNKARHRAADGSELENAIDLAHCPGNRIPDSLSAVAMKAMAVDPVSRYQTVPGLQAEIASFQGGFATSAEQAGAWRLLVLAVKRRKTEFALGATAVIVILALVAGFMAKVLSSERRAQATLRDLRATAPLLRTEIDHLMAAQKFAEALPKTENLCSLLPDDADCRVLKGNLLQSLLLFSEARTAYEEALRLNPAQKAARENLALCRKFASQSRKTVPLREEDFMELQAALSQQGRYIEASALMRHVVKNRQQLFESWKARLRKAGLEDKLVQQIQMNQDGLLNWNIDGSFPLADLTALQGMPFRSIMCTRGLSQVSDLRPLRGMPLEYLGVTGERLVDLTALAGMRLKGLVVSNSKVSDLSPLKGMPLEGLGADYTKIADLSPLQAMPLRELSMRNTAIVDLTPIAGAPLESLLIRDCTNLRDLSPLRGMPLKQLQAHGCTGVSDLAPLATCKELELATIPLTARNVEVLRSLPKLKKLAFTLPDEDWNKIPPVEEFWKAYDARKGGKK